MSSAGRCMGLFTVCFRLPTSLPVLFLTGVLLGSVSCRRASIPVDDPNAVAWVEGRPVSAEAVAERLSQRVRVGGVESVSPEDRVRALDEAIRVEALYAQAVRAGWHTNAELQAAFRRTVAAKYRESMLPVTEAIPEESEIAAYYQKNLVAFTKPAAVRAAVLLVEAPVKATDEKRAEAMARAVALREQALVEVVGLPHFGDLARQHSVDQATRYVGGDFDWLPLGLVESRYGADVVVALEGLELPGAISAPVETTRGIALVKLIEHQPAAPRPLDEVRELIRHRLTADRRAQAESAFLASVTNGLSIRINPEALAAIPLPVASTEPPAGPGSL